MRCGAATRPELWLGSLRGSMREPSGAVSRRSLTTWSLLVIDARSQRACAQGGKPSIPFNVARCPSLSRFRSRQASYIPSRPASPAMQHVVKHEPLSSMLQVGLGPGEVLVAEAGSMIARSPGLAADVKLDAGRSAGFIGALKALVLALIRKLVGGEMLFVRHISA